LELDKNKDVSEIFRKSFEIPIQFGFRKGESRASSRFRKLIDETTVGSDFREIAGLTEERLPEITVPVLALYGETSPYIKIATYLSAVLPNCRHKTLPATGHFDLLQGPDVALEGISPFLFDPMGYIRGERKASDRQTVQEGLSETSKGVISPLYVEELNSAKEVPREVNKNE